MPPHPRRVDHPIFDRFSDKKCRMTSTRKETKSPKNFFLRNYNYFLIRRIQKTPQKRPRPFCKKIGMRRMPSLIPSLMPSPRGQSLHLSHPGWHETKIPLLIMVIQGRSDDALLSFVLTFISAKNLYYKFYGNVLFLRTLFDDSHVEGWQVTRDLMIN